MNFLVLELVHITLNVRDDAFWIYLMVMGR